VAEIDPLQWPVPAKLMAECNFDSLKEAEELEAAYYYEHARQSRSVRGAVWRKARGKKEKVEAGKGAFSSNNWLGY
jgi:hypothetical protein